MKKISLLLFISSVLTVAQTSYVNGQATNASADPAQAFGVRSMANLRSTNYHVLSPSAKQPGNTAFINLMGYYGPGDGGGGFFYWSDTLNAADNGGTIIKPASVTGAGRWKRVIDQQTPVNVLWFGFVADGVTDNYPAFVRLKNWLYNNRIGYDISNPAYPYYARLHNIYFPGRYKPYYFSHTLHFEHSVTISGDEAWYQNWPSKLLFPADSVGIHFAFVDEYVRGTGSVGNIVRNIELQAATDGTYDTTAHGFKVRAPALFENVYVHNFGGNGFDLNSTDPITSNLDFCDLRNCKAYYNWNGCYIKGGEANVISTSNCDFSINRKWGLYDIGFLGNIHTRDHASSNGVTAGQKTYVIHRTGGVGKRYEYAAKRDGYLKRPGDSKGWENDWELVGDSTVWHNGDAPDYNASTYYWVGGSFYIETGRLMFCYDEAGSQMGRYLGLYAGSYGGIHGSGFQWNSIGVFQSEYGGQLVLDHGGYTVGDFAKKYTTLQKDGFDIRDITHGDGIGLAYDSTLKTGVLKELNSGSTLTRITTGATDPSAFSRKSLTAGSLLNLGGVYSSSYDNTSLVKRLIYGSKVPVSGYWNAGDMIINNNPADRPEFGWRCVTAGSPGTWETIFLPISDYVAKTGAYNITSTDHTIEVTANSNSYTLPSASGISGRVYIIKNTGTGKPVVNTTGSQTIDGMATYTLSAQYRYVSVQSNGSNWIIIANN